MPSAPRPGTHVQGSSSCPTDSAYADTAGSLDTSPTPTTTSPGTAWGTASATALVPVRVPVPVWVTAMSELAGGLLAVPQSGREAPWATQDGAGAECAVEAAGDTAGAAVSLPGPRGRRAPCEQPICVAAAVAVTR